MTAELALEHGLAVNTAGGTHHAFRDSGSGFCIINDFAITAEVLLARGDVSRVLILDLDVHQVSSSPPATSDRSPTDENATYGSRECIGLVACWHAHCAHSLQRRTCSELRSYIQKLPVFICCLVPCADKHGAEPAAS